MITLVRDTGGDWVALYKDGRFLDANHSLADETILDATEVTYEIKWVDYQENDLSGHESLVELEPYFTEA